MTLSATHSQPIGLIFILRPGSGHFAPIPLLLSSESHSLLSPGLRQEPCNSPCFHPTPMVSFPQSSQRESGKLDVRSLQIFHQAPHLLHSQSQSLPGPCVSTQPLHLWPGFPLLSLTHSLPVIPISWDVFKIFSPDPPSAWKVLPANVYIAHSLASLKSLLRCHLLGRSSLPTLLYTS